MKFVALVSGGKDSIYAITQCINQGNQLVCLANLHPIIQYQELNSYMYQSVGAEVIEGLAECLNKPLLRRIITGKPVSIKLDYSPTADDEVEDLFELLKSVKHQFPEIQAVSSGAIMSTYQKNRVEEVCGRLGLISLAPLWQKDQIELLGEMVKNNINAVLVRVGSYGLKEQHLGKSIAELKDYLINLQRKFDCQCCGEGGEYESLVLDCPLFVKKIKLVETEIVVEVKNEITFVGHLIVKKFLIVDK